MTQLPEGDKPPVGLRERKKLKTRAAIREHALRLFVERGYAQTTVEQIAEAAEVSPSTFFRYFPTKEDLVATVEHQPTLATMILEQPPQVGPIQAVRAAVWELYESLSPELRQLEYQRLALLSTVPELRPLVHDRNLRSVDRLSEVYAQRLGREPNDFKLRVLAGAVAGVLLAAAPTQLDGSMSDYLDRLDQALALLAAGLPL